MGLCLSSQALGLALGTMPAESREEAPTHPRPAREDGGVGGEGRHYLQAPPPPEGRANPKPSLIAILEGTGGLAGAEGPCPFKRSDSALQAHAPQTKGL